MAGKSLGNFANAHLEAVWNVPWYLVVVVVVVALYCH